MGWPKYSEDNDYLSEDRMYNTFRYNENMETFDNPDKKKSDFDWFRSLYDYGVGSYSSMTGI